jgi:CheY-like chemotaxis protein
MILVVDDELLIRFAIGRILKRQGYDVIEAVDGLEALAVVSQRRVDLVITDLEMPKLDGADLALSYRNLRRPYPWLGLHGRRANFIVFVNFK